MHRDEPEAVFVATANAVAVLKQGVDVCDEDLGRERLLKAFKKSNARPRLGHPAILAMFGASQTI